MLRMREHIHRGKALGLIAQLCQGDKVAGKGEKRIESLRLAEIYGAKVIDASTEHFVFQVTGASPEIERFIKIMTELGLVEVSRTGIAAMARGAKGL